MIKNIMMLSLFVVSWAISAMEQPKFIELDCAKGTYSSCQGRCYEQETCFNNVSNGQKLWLFQDPAIEYADESFQYPLIDYEHNALKVHTCYVTPRKGGYFSSMLIAKFELDPGNTVPERILNVFMLQAIFQGRNKIYAWVEEKSLLLYLLETNYCFREPQEILFIPLTEKEVSFPQDPKIIQLEANKQDIINLFN